MQRLIFFLLLIAAGVGCEKDAGTAEQVELYLLDKASFIPGKCQVDPAASFLKGTPTIKNSDIITYSKDDHAFTLTETAFQKIKNLQDRTPFAITVDQEVIYYGIFKPSISSSSCDHSITMDIGWPSGNSIVLRLGYPGGLQGISIDDRRNDLRLLSALKRQGKLR